ncbi:MFS transporter [Bombilactobacillus thymidiniphilus]|uniref:MFS transporter n=1 Tax=Bombilactobacillus thymidiniphilus TaxID=2923363 RepID=A0ABY4PF18_9LACO|nr:MFS transporter [Bombilactobacillus thymidiniphilus]UQS84165.1 MFS transporter [Bombilactobacillus thymidiniphilus]
MSKLHNLRWQVFVLVLTSFALGFSEFVIVGILNDIARQLHTSVVSVGSLVTWFALIYALSTPIIATALGHFNLYKSITSLMLVFIVGNLLSAVANSFGLLAISRVITALVSGVLVSIAMTFANYIAPMDKRPRLVAGIYSGFSIASVLGVPVGTWVSVQFGWHQTFWLIVILSIVTLILMFICLPRDIVPPKSNLKAQLSLLTDKKILVGMWLPMLNLAAIYPLYTYLRPILSSQLHFSAGGVTLILFLYGITSIVSNQISGVLAEHNGLRLMAPIYVGLIIMLLIFPLSFNWRLISVLLILMIGIVMYVVSSPIAIFYLDIAEQKYPQSILLASSINSIFSNFGIALGSATGSGVFQDKGLSAVASSGVLYAILAIAVVLIIVKLERIQK